jgi:hypothetical protein
MAPLQRAADRARASPRYSEIRFHAAPHLTLSCSRAARTASFRNAPAETLKEILMSHHAHGTFTVDIRPLTPPPAEDLGRFSIDKQIHGDLEGVSKGEMLSGGDPKQGVAGYVAIESVTGTLGGKQGSFALQHFATMDATGPRMQVIVVPGSGTGELKGVAGTFVIHNDKGQHSYDFDYTLPGEDS